MRRIQSQTLYQRLRYSQHAMGQQDRCVELGGVHGAQDTSGLGGVASVQYSCSGSVEPMNPFSHRYV